MLNMKIFEQQYSKNEKMCTSLTKESIWFVCLFFKALANIEQIFAITGRNFAVSKIYLMDKVKMAQKCFCLFCLRLFFTFFMFIKIL